MNLPRRRFRERQPRSPFRSSTMRYPALALAMLCFAWIQNPEDLPAATTDPLPSPVLLRYAADRHLDGEEVAQHGYAPGAGIPNSNDAGCQFSTHYQIYTIKYHPERYLVECMNFDNLITL